ncbi:MAG TPA: magnesium-translocating P-type ATPase [Anaerolineae bacterium]|nr:magnesium-translocating P-type ATPase [Anaerolineae bacterium]HQH37537.1 magnesium-translocating P-type ATPase [Anaerolineae bacterium]
MSTQDTLTYSYWGQTTEQLLTMLQSSAAGLTTPEAQQRLEQYGPNVLETHAEVTPLRLFLKQFRDPIVLILLFATTVSAVTQEWIDAGIILVIVVGSALLSFFQEYRAGNAAAKLRAQITPKATVLRDGQAQSIPAEEVVPGDVVQLSAGSLIPADGVLLEATDFYVNQAVLTGETFPVEKRPGPVAEGASLPERTNCVFMGTNVRSGSAKALIVQTGAATVFGQVAKRLTVRPPETEFERGIHRLGYMLTRVMFILVFLVFAVNVFFHKPVLDSLLFSVALAVGLTPQLLPAIISITLSKGSQRMAADGVIVRRLESIENFGSMDVLCTDKTGTLTLGVVSLDGAVDVQGQSSEDVFRYAYLNACFETGLSNPLDEAITAHAQPDVTGYTKVDEVPYDFVRKRLSIVVQTATGLLQITKGALDNVLEVCTQVQEGAVSVPLDDDRQQQIQQRYTAWSEQGFRVLGVAVRMMPEQARYTRRDEHDMTFVGFLLFFDPPKPGVRETIAALEELGVQLKIITGDNKLVARHAANAVGMTVTGMLTGAEIADMSDEALWHAAEHANLFAEVDPNEKERLILAQKKLGHVVGYMGDGINDAPALHAADVGISVDTAVDVAKEAADFVLLKHDLSVLRQGIVLGRTTFANTLKYVFTTVSANFGNMFSMAGASLFLPFLPLLPLQILLTNFLTDLPSMNIAGDSVDQMLINQPRRWNVAFIRDFMITFGITSSVFDYLTFGVLLLILKANETQFHTGWFLESILTELLIVFIVRTQQPFYKSRPGRMLWMVTLIVAGVTLALPYSPLNTLLGLDPLPLPIFLALIGITMLYLLASETVKHFFYRKEHV